MENFSFSWDSWDTMGICISYSTILGVQLKLQMARTMVRHAMTCPSLSLPAKIRWNDAPEWRQDRINDGWQHSLNLLDNLLGAMMFSPMHDTSQHGWAESQRVLLWELWTASEDHFGSQWCRRHTTNLKTCSPLLRITEVVPCQSNWCTTPIEFERQRKTGQISNLFVAATLFNQ